MLQATNVRRDLLDVLRDVAEVGLTMAVFTMKLNGTISELRGEAQVRLHDRFIESRLY
jgi:hypothetical protein